MELETPFLSIQSISEWVVDALNQCVLYLMHFRLLHQDKEQRHGGKQTRSEFSFYEFS